MPKARSRSAWSPAAVALTGWTRGTGMIKFAQAVKGTEEAS
jgi:3-oxoacyl-ACP reductase-like protein